MKHIALYFGMVAALVVSCSTQEEDFNTPLQDDVIFYASFEQPAEDGTRVYANEDLLLRWTADDRVSIFNKITYNQQYKFLGETGDNSGGFNRVDAAEFVTGNPIPHVVSVYPYQEATKITEEEVLTLTLSAEQHYAENTFGLGANTMVSVSSDNVLLYKNVGGYLVIKLYGEGVSVSSITLKGNNSEKLAGKATVTMPVDGLPSLEMASDALTEVTLTCETPVQLGATAAESTMFWFVIPAVTFSKGFTVTVSGAGGIFEKSTDKTLTIERNKVSTMSPVEVELTPTQPRNIIYYTSMDGTVLTPNRPDAFGVPILSNDYADGLGIIVFDGDVTSIGVFAFYGCTSLTSITLPDSVTSIGNSAFQDCTSLTSITLPDSVTSIWTYAFSGCTSLTSITLPDSVTSIGRYAFSGCTSLTSITLPDSVTYIGEGVFSGCFSILTFSGKFSSMDGLFLIDSGSLIAVAWASIEGDVVIPNDVTRIGDGIFSGLTSLTSITLPDSVTSIGDYAFLGCTSLTSITLPGSVTRIGTDAFHNCRSLTSITLPDSLTRIGMDAFYNCTSLTSITLPDSVTSIGYNAFYGCTSLTSITVESVVPPTVGWGMFDETDNCPIYVPAESVEAYKSAQYWSDYADRIQAIPSSSVPVPEAIDLGLPSGIKWASFNLGASKPEEYGDYYAWGETEPYYSSLDPLTWKEGKSEGYSWSSYKWCNYSPSSGFSYYLTKYCTDSSYGYNGFVDGKTVLEPEDDAAHVNLGGEWRMPTDSEWRELIDNCTWTWATKNGVNGRLVIATNGNSIFLPAAGRQYGTSLFDVVSKGLYWSSSLLAGNSLTAIYVSFNSSNVGRSDHYRSYGYSVRPVCE